MNDQVWCGPIGSMSRGVPALVVLIVVPYSTVEIVLHEPELFGCILGERVEEAVVSEVALNFRPIVALNPVRHVASIRSSECDGTVSIDLGFV